jgi:hypothetical protein
MPLLDHFHPPWSDENPWEGFHSAWVNTMVRHLNGTLLPRRFRAFPQIHLGPFVEADVATFEELSGPPPAAEPSSVNGGAVAWSPPEPVQTLEVELPAQDVFEVRIHDEQHGKRLAAVGELISPANKDRPEHRQAFTAKCAAYLQEQVNVLVIDVVTSRCANLHRELQKMFSVGDVKVDLSDLYCVSYRNRKVGAKWRLETWPFALQLGARLPTVPLWLTPTLSVPLDLEKSYEETCQVLRIG